MEPIDTDPVPLFEEDNKHVRFMFPGDDKLRPTCKLLFIENEPPLGFDRHSRNDDILPDDGEGKMETVD